MIKNPGLVDGDPIRACPSAKTIRCETDPGLSGLLLPLMSPVVVAHPGEVGLADARATNWEPGVAFGVCLAAGTSARSATVTATFGDDLLSHLDPPEIDNFSLFL